MFLGPHAGIDAVRLVPDGGVLKIELYGELAALLALGQNQRPKNKHPQINNQGVQVTLVAGASNIQDPTIIRQV